MSVDRPTFSESWYRVSVLKPRLRSTVQIYRQHFRGRMWHVVQDPANNQYFRLDDAGYFFVGLLDGNRTVDQAWETCMEELGDRAPTQGEAINLMGQLYTSNLLQSDIPADAAGMFERYRKRVRREIGGYLSNIMFLRIPLFDPENILERWVKVGGLAFTWFGFVVWLALLGTAATFLAGHWDRLISGADGVLDPANLPYLYISFGIIKAIHEFGHGFACKRFGKTTGTGGEVHTMGIMLLVFTPVPYVDASSSWAFRNKWHRAVVGAAGMYVELAVASIAAIVWANTSPGAVHAITYNMLFIASVSTLLFNGNPLLRFDGYYILSDILEIPNLQQRSKQYLYYLVKKYVYGVKRARNVLHTPGEGFWLPTFGVTSFIYRVIICVGIIMFVADKLFIVGMLLAASAIVAWVMMPMGKFAKYLVTSGELMRTRPRAIIATVVFFAVVFGSVGAIPFPDRDRADGVIEPIDVAIVHVMENGFVKKMSSSGINVSSKSDPLISAESPELDAERARLVAERRLTEIQRNLADVNEVALAQSLTQRMDALDAQIRQIDLRLSHLKLAAPIEGVWISPQIEQLEGAFAREGDAVGLIASVDRLFIRAMADQELGPRIGPEIGKGKPVEIRVKGRPDIGFTGTIREIREAGQSELPSAALGYLGGGSMQVAMDDPSGRKTIEPFFEVLIDIDEDSAEKLKLLSGQRVVVRFEMASKPLAIQWWRAIRQLVQRRFSV